MKLNDMAVTGLVGKWEIEIRKIRNVHVGQPGQPSWKVSGNCLKHAPQLHRMPARSQSTSSAMFNDFAFALGPGSRWPGTLGARITSSLNFPGK